MCKDIKLLAIDLDGTLLRDDKSISKYSINTINKCRKNGIIVFLATARPLRVVLKLLEQMNVCVDGIIANNGATIYTNGTHVCDCYIGRNAASGIICELQCNGVDYYDIETGAELYCSENAPFYSDEIWNARQYKNQICLNKIIKITFKPNDDFNIGKLYKYDSEVTIKVCGDNLVQITSRLCNKMRALDVVLDKYNLTENNVAAFGDDDNDKDMIENCIIGIAMKNASLEIKNAANYVCDTNQEDGVARWIINNLNIKMT